ncbi:hypothetical protein RB195_013355 [Necator americanus]|uniref:Reverse transcriptase domain-containing protein n=1 Tax=Necator americanus TaxID=51031 RepID=A0ABR1DWA2_NECAM
MPLKKVFDTVETEPVMEASDNQNQSVLTPYIEILGELYSNFTNKISPFYNDVMIDVKTEVRQGDTIFSTTLENAKRRLEWDDMGVEVYGRHLHHLRFADYIVLMTPSINQAELMLAEYDETCKKLGL